MFVPYKKQETFLPLFTVMRSRAEEIEIVCLQSFFFFFPYIIHICEQAIQPITNEKKKKT